MVRRSRGCKECRSRRVGCDLGSPSCRQCIITNRTCSGPLKEVMIIDQTADVASRQKAHSVRQTRHVTQPSSQGLVSLAYVEHFFGRLTPLTKAKAPQPWLLSVRNLPHGIKGPALDLAIEAAATVSCGVTNGHTAVVQQACQMYATVVAQHYQVLSHSEGVPTAAIFFTTVTLSLFESLYSTNITAFATHLRAARKMLGLAGPSLLQIPMVQDIAIYVQYQTLLAMIIAPVEHLAATEGTESWTDMSQFQWLGVPSVIGRLVIHLFHLGDCMARHLYTSAHMTPIDLHSTAAAVESLWNEYVGEASDHNELLQWVTEGQMHYRDEVTAITIAYFEAARILYSLIHSHHAQAQGPSQSILHCVAYLSNHPTNCATLRIFFPLTLVALHSPFVQQRQDAQRALDNWLSRSGFTGLYSIIKRKTESSALQLTTRNTPT